MVNSINLVGTPQNIEYLGTKPKFWYQLDGKQALFKVGRDNTGENWAEVLAYELCKVLDIPAAEYLFAQWDQNDDGNLIPGVSTINFVPKGSRLIHGNEILFGEDPNYPREKKFKIKKHNLTRVFRALEKIQLRLPTEYQGEPINAIVLFCGYIIFDAFIGNTDRHHENWGIILGTDGHKYLAPTFDHASCLGRELTDAKRQFKLETKDKNQDLLSYSARTKSCFNHRDDEKTRLTCMQAAEECLKQYPASKMWIEKIINLDDVQIQDLLSDFKTEWMSDISKRFALQVLKMNRNKLRELL